MMDAAVARGRITVAALVGSHVPRARAVASGNGKLKVLWKTTSRHLASAQQGRDGGERREMQTTKQPPTPMIVFDDHASLDGIRCCV